MIELRHLRYFVAVAEEGHMTRAALRLGIQQPPLSQQIRVLERLAGAALFRRLPRGVALTEAGAVLLERARAILGDVDLALKAVGRTARGEQGSLAVGFTSSAAFHPLVAFVVRALRQSVPDVTLALEEGSTAELVQALYSDRLDAAFVRGPVEGASDGRLRVERVMDEEMLVAVPGHHRLAAAAGGRLSLADLTEETFILYRRPAGPGLYDGIIAACRAAGFSPRVGQEAPRLVSTLSLVSAGLGISIVPASMARLETEGIAYLRMTDRPPLTAPLYLACRAGAPSGALARFVETVKRWDGAYCGGRTEAGSSAVANQ